jgi:recombinational DNA repair protein (RecF pathway)
MLYSAHALVLAKYEIKDREKSYILLTREYGKITGFYKEPRSGVYADIGSLIEVLIETKLKTNTLKSIQSISAISTEFLKYESVHEYLLILEGVRRQLPDSAGEWIYEEFAPLFTNAPIDQEQYASQFSHLLFLLKLRLLSHFQGIPGSITSIDPLISKLDRLAGTNTLTQLLRIQGIPLSAKTQIHTLFLQFFLQ